MTFWEFLADLTLADWVLLFVAWVIIAFALGAFTGLAIKRADEAERDESLAEWLAVWPTDAKPEPREWVA